MIRRHDKTNNQQPPLSDIEAEARGIKVDRDGLVRCRVCGCTEIKACYPPCSWHPGEADLCSGCHRAAFSVRYWMAGAHRANMSALLREVARMKANEENGYAEQLRQVRKAGGEA